jgi:G3E family GTPase
MTMTGRLSVQQELPVTLLTGFLGSGKTTLVNRILTGAHQMRIGVVVNEFGELGIDSRLLASNKGPVVELLNGCICCASEGDLLRGFNTMLADGVALDAVLIETSGLADPWPIVQALERWRFARDLRLWSVVTLVDAEHYDLNLDRAEAAFQQLTAADLIVINKSDLVDAMTPRRIAEAVSLVNLAAKTIVCRNAEILTEVVLDQQHLTLPSPARRSHSHAPDGFESAVLRADAHLDPELFDAWLGTLSRDVVRMKGFVRFVGEAGPLVFDLVGSRPSVRPPERYEAVAGAELVVIGRSLRPADLQLGLERCVV